MYIISSILVIFIFIELIYSQYLETPGRDDGIPNNPEYFGKSCKLLTNKAGPNNSSRPNGMKIYCGSRFLIWPEEVPQYVKLIKFSAIAIGQSENLVKEEFHIYQTSSHSEKLKLTVFNVRNDNVNNKAEISSIIVDENTNGWRIFDVSSMLTDPKDEERNYTFIVTATSITTNNNVKIDYVRINDAVMPTKMPIYVHFLNLNTTISRDLCRNSIDVYNIENGDAGACNVLR